MAPAYQATHNYTKSHAHTSRSHQTRCVSGTGRAHLEYSPVATHAKSCVRCVRDQSGSLLRRTAITDIGNTYGVCWQSNGGTSSRSIARRASVAPGAAAQPVSSGVSRLRNVVRAVRTTQAMTAFTATPSPFGKRLSVTLPPASASAAVIAAPTGTAAGNTAGTPTAEGGASSALRDMSGIFRAGGKATSGCVRAVRCPLGCCIIL